MSEMCRYSRGSNANCMSTFLVRLVAYQYLLASLDGSPVIIVAQDNDLYDHDLFLSGRTYNDENDLVWAERPFAACLAPVRFAFTARVFAPGLDVDQVLAIR